MSTLLKFFRFHKRFLCSVAVGVLAFFVIPDHWRLIGRLLVSWDIGVYAFLLMLCFVIARQGSEQINNWADQEDETAIAVLSLVTAAAIMSLCAIVFEFATAKATPGELGSRVALTLATVLGSWLIVPVLFTLHYARLYYSAPEDRQPLRFPDSDLQPTYWDFLYFSFTIAVASQTADIAITAPTMRRVVLAHAILSFFFNAAIIGFSVNIAASLVGSS